MNTSFGIDYRSEMLQKLGQQNEPFDLIIIGGGITGSGILLDAVSRGLNVLLIEKNDFASGTSSRSTKLIHGGLRYLKQLEFKIVRDTGRERAIAYKNAPHLVIPEKMVLPIVKNGTYGTFSTSIGLFVYDWMAGVAKAERRVMKSKEEALKLVPLINESILIGAGFYSEYRTDDARLTISVLKTAVAKGALALNYVSCENFTYSPDGKVNGVIIRDSLTQKELEVKGTFVVNAAGPWSDELREINKSSMSKRLHLTKGVHIVVSKEKFPLQHSVYFDVADKRMIFAIPRGEKVYIGTTDTDYKGEKDEPTITKEDVTYLINAANQMFPQLHLEINAIESSWSGLRPLIHQEGKSPSSLSRKDEVFISNSGLITIAGGKLTGYRLMAKKITDLIAKERGLKKSCATENIKISGYTGAYSSMQVLENEVQSHLQNKSITGISAGYLVNNYGEEALVILDAYASNNQSCFEVAEAKYTIEHESVVHLLDFYVRRTGRMFFLIETIAPSLMEVAALFAAVFNWTPEQKQAEIDAVINEIKARTHFS